MAALALLRTGTALGDATTLLFTTAHVPSSLNHDSEEIDLTMQEMAAIQPARRIICILGMDANVDLCDFADATMQGTNDNFERNGKSQGNSRET